MKIGSQKQANMQSVASSTRHLIRYPSALELEYIALRNLGFEVNLAKGRLHPDFPLHTVQTEALRMALWMHSNQGTQQVHINRILRAAQRLLRPIWEHRGKTASSYQLASGNEDIDLLADVREEASVDERLYVLHRDALNELEAIGDIVELPYGYWIPAPLRAVPLPKSGHWLLVGGIPTNRLPNIVHKHLKYSNYARLLDRAPAVIGFSCTQQSFASWTEQPADKLLVWTKRIVYETMLEPARSQEDYYLYVPAAGQTQKARWTKVHQQIKDGRYLACTRSGAHTHYCIVLLKHGSILQRGEIAWGIRDPQRLCYGMDLQHTLPVRIREKRISDGYLLTITDPLPKAEQRLLIALGHVNTRSPEYYPSEWTIPTEYISDIRAALKQIGVHVKSS